MDGFDARDNVIVMAASNLLEKLDKALLRPGRFDRQVFVPPPDMRGRKRILEVHTRDKPLAQDVDLERVARHAAGLTGADLANLCNEAAILAGRNQREFVTQDDFESAFERVVAGPPVAQGDHGLTRSGWSPGTRPGTRSSRSCCPRWTRSRRSRSCRAARRSATRSTFRRRIAI